MVTTEEFSLKKKNEEHVKYTTIKEEEEEEKSLSEWKQLTSHTRDGKEEEEEEIFEDRPALVERENISKWNEKINRDKKLSGGDTWYLDVKTNQREKIHPRRSFKKEEEETMFSFSSLTNELL